jgi:predicted transcriptional regulator
VLADSTVRTILRRLEAKGYISHKAAGRGHIYFGVAPQRVAVGAIRQIIDRFCSGSVEQLVLGMVENEILDSRELQRLSRVVAQREKGKV